MPGKAGSHMTTDPRSPISKGPAAVVDQLAVTITVSVHQHLEMNPVGVPNLAGQRHAQHPEQVPKTPSNRLTTL